MTTDDAKLSKRLSTRDKERVEEDSNSALPIDDETLFHYAQIGQPCTNEKGEALLHLDKDEETALRHKLDRHILPLAAIMYFCCFLDRSNIGNAKSAGLEEDLGMKAKSYDFNFLVMAFYITYFFTEAPLTFMAKQVGPSRVLPICVCGFGIMTICFAFVNNLTQAIVVRCFLAVFEAPMLPSLAYYLSRYYRRTELTVRCASYMAMAPLSSAIGSLLCSGILKLHSIGSLKRWEMIFVIEGTITVILGIASIFFLPEQLETTKFLTPRERALGVVRLKSERVTTVGVLDAMRLVLAKRGAFSITPLLVGISVGVFSLTAQATGIMLPSIVKTLFPKHSLPEQQALSSPPYFLGLIFEVGLAYAATKTGRFYFCLLVCITFGALGFIINLSTTSHQTHARYAATFFTTVFSFSSGACAVGWVAVNANSDTERAGALAFLIALGNIANIAAAWVYLPSDAPNYKRANSANLAMVCLCFCSLTTWFFVLRRENNRRARGERDHRIQGLSFAEQQLLGSRHPGFKYHY